MILHEAARAVPSSRGKCPGYCYMAGHGPISRLLGHVTGLLFRLYVKVFLPSIFISVNFWSSVSYIVLDFEVANINIFKEFGVFINKKIQGYPFPPPKTRNPQKKHFGIREFCRDSIGTVNVWFTVSFQKNFQKIRNLYDLQREHKELRLLAKYWTRRWKFWWSWHPQNSSSCWSWSRWWNLDLPELLHRKQIFTSLCRAQSKNDCWLNTAAFEDVYFPLWIVLSVST